MRLTKTTCDAVRYEGSGGFFAVWDSDIRGFGLRVSPAGVKTFIIKYRCAGRQRILSIGRFGVLTCDQARRRARELLVDVSRGVDPAEKKAVAIRVSELCAAYLEYSKIHKKSFRCDKNRVAARILPDLGRRVVVSIKHADIERYHRKIGEKTPYEANRLLALISAMIEYGRKNGLIPIDYTNPTRFIERFREHSKKTFLPLKDVPRLLEALESESVYISSLVKLIIFTGARKTELLTALWENVNLDEKTLRLPDTKGGRAFDLALSPAALGVIENLPRMEGSPYLFPSLTTPGARLWEVGRPWRRICKRAGFSDKLTLHDLRRSVGSWLAADGVSLQIIGRVLNHSNQRTTAIYARLTDDPARRALEMVAEKITAIDAERVDEKPPASSDEDNN